MTILTSASAIAAEISERLARISIANGCETDIGLRVCRGRRKIDEDMVPCAVLIEGDDQVKDRPGKLPTVELKQGYVLGGYVECDADHPNDAAHAVIRDIKRALWGVGDGGNFGGKVRAVSYTGRDIGPRADGVNVVFAVVQVDVEYVETLSQP